MAKVKVLERSFINGAIREEGDIIEDFDGEVGSNLELLSGGAPAKKGKKASASPVDSDEGTQAPESGDDNQEK